MSSQVGFADISSLVRLMNVPYSQQLRHLESSGESEKHSIWFPEIGFEVFNTSAATSISRTKEFRSVRVQTRPSITKWSEENNSVGSFKAVVQQIRRKLTYKPAAASPLELLRHFQEEAGLVTEKNFCLLKTTEIQKTDLSGDKQPSPAQKETAPISKRQKIALPDSPESVAADSTERAASAVGERANPCVFKPAWT